MLRIDRYITFNFILGIAPVMLLLLSLFSFLALADALSDVGKGSFVLLDALKVVALTTPKRLLDLLPVITLLGGVVGLGVMANHAELVVIQAAGMSKRRISRPIFLLALALVGLELVLQLVVVPLSEHEAIQVKSKSLQQTKVGQNRKLEFWTRSKDSFVRVKEVRFDRSLSDIEIYRVGPSGRLTQVFQASTADITNENNWLLSDVLQSDLGEFKADEKHLETMNWPGLLSSEQAATLILPIQALSPVDLFRYIDYLKKNKLNTHRYRVVFWQQASAPIVLVAMALLSLPFLLGSERHTSTSQRVITGGIAGIGFYLIQQVTGNLAGLLQLNPPLTMMAPALFLMSFAVYRTLKP